MNIRKFLLLAILFFPAACASAEQTYVMDRYPDSAPAKPALIEVPSSVRVGLAWSDSVCTFRFEGGAIARDESGRDFVITEERLTVASDSSGLRWIFDGGVPGPTSAAWRFSPLGDSPLWVNGALYRGTIELLYRRPAPETCIVVVVNEVDLESYIRGVVANEIGFIRPENLEAMKAQAIAARTYAVRNLGRRRALGFDLFASHDDQVYRGLTSETLLTDRAVLATEGEILEYNGEIVEGFYHSTCGGHTAAMRDIWGAGRPYLEGVSDMIGDTAACAASVYYTWKEVYQGETLARLAAPYDTVIITVLEKDRSGRNKLVKIDRGDSSLIIRGDVVRTAIRRPNGAALRSSFFDVVRETGTLILKGRGWGHGIGMCQVGAIGRARAGRTYGEILAHYYPGTNIMKMRKGAGNG